MSSPTTVSARTRDPMESWIVGTKLLLLAYAATDCTLRGGGNETSVVLAALAFVCSSTLFHLARKRAPRLLAAALTIGVVATSGLIVEPVFATLLPLTAAELAYELLPRIPAALLPSLVVALFVAPERMPSYILAACFGLTVFLLATRSGLRLRALDDMNESLRASNRSLRDKASRGAEYEETLTHLAHLEERNRLAVEVHDRVGHAISGGMIQLEAASAVLESDPRSARAMIATSVGALRDGMESIRSVLRGSRPAPEELGIQRVRTMLDRFAVDGETSARLAHGGELREITPAQWGVITDNLRECLTNTRRHSGARAVQVRIEVMNRIITSEVRDDGRGAATFRKGLGIAGMEERTERIGGKLVVDGSRGFSVITVLPISSGSDDAH